MRKERKEQVHSRYEDQRRSRMKKRVRRKLGWRFALIAVCLCLISVAAVNITRLQVKKARLEAENAMLTEEIKDKEQELANVDDLEYIEGQARERLNMVYKDEKVYLMPDEEE